MVYGQRGDLDDLQEFTTPFTNEDLNTPITSSSLIDSSLQISEGVFILVQLTNEKKFWNNGQLKFNRYYQGNKPFGTWKYFTKNGNLKYTLVNFKNDFIVKLHFDNNNIRSIRKYPIHLKANVTGCAEENYYPDGSMQAYGKKEPAKKFNHWELLESGKWHYFHPNGTKESEGKYKNGVKEGKWLFYNKLGDKIRIATFKNGVLVTQKEY
tara:strand:+ start:119857 stop:120486 length:630 start_codon:yes stop_codon:yes gene_type:complete